MYDYTPKKKVDYVNQRDRQNYLLSNTTANHISENHNRHRVNWNAFSSNSNAIPLLEINLTPVNWSFLSTNPNPIPLLVLEKQDLYELDYFAMREEHKGFSEEIAKFVWHPSRRYVWPEDPFIYDPEDDMDYEVSNCTIRNIRNDIRRKS